MQWINAAVLLSAIWSTCWNIWASVEAPRPMRTLYMSIAVHSLVYVLAYLWLIFDDDLDRALWSRVLTPFGISAFIVVWSGHAMISAPLRRRERKQLSDK